ncbi:MFS transporter [Streptomyces sp. SL13]|uniref:MFS transporter n=1 Tax=Streptantibioticus silvisoli TaxID=2705255 RepID=A0AA90KIC7_9ACTN|nr:MFS transporter [Streptantibioticus silvisoli]MDI5972479.1 MFS transporter [Streptantibioticus silvisoli]
MTSTEATEVPGKRFLGALIGLLSANAAALSANRVLSIALPWFVLTTTGSIGKTGLVAFCQILPYVISQALSGPVIDRIGPKKVSVFGDLTSMTAMAIAPVLYLTGTLSFGVLLMLLAVVGIADGPANGAKGLFVPPATRAARVPLERGTGLCGAVERTATTVGPAIAGVIVASFGSVYALWVTSALFGVSALIVSTTLTNPVPEPDELPVDDSAGYLVRLREGADFLRGAGLLRAIVGMLAATNLLDQAFMTVLLPVWAKESGNGPAVIGLVVSVFAATSIVAALVAAGLAERLPRRTIYLVGMLIGGIPRFVAMAAGVPLWGVLAVLAIGGLGSGFVNPIVGAVTYELIPTALLGRVKTLAQAVTWAGIPFGGLVGAGLVTVAGVTGALWIVGGLYLVAIGVPGMSRQWAGMRKAPATAAPTAPTGEPAASTAGEREPAATAAREADAEAARRTAESAPELATT